MSVCLRVEQSNKKTSAVSFIECFVCIQTAQHQHHVCFPLVFLAMYNSYCSRSVQKFQSILNCSYMSKRRVLTPCIDIYSPCLRVFPPQHTFLQLLKFKNLDTPHDGHNDASINLRLCKRACAVFTSDWSWLLVYRIMGEMENGDKCCS
jgi:hypothetical protein